MRACTCVRNKSANPKHRPVESPFVTGVSGEDARDAGEDWAALAASGAGLAIVLRGDCCGGLRGPAWRGGEQTR